MVLQKMQAPVEIRDLFPDPVNFSGAGNRKTRKSRLKPGIKDHETDTGMVIRRWTTQPNGLRPGAGGCRSGFPGFHEEHGRQETGDQENRGER